MLQAGTGKRRITIPEEILPLEDFLKVHDDIHARVVYIRSNEDFVFVSLELTSLREYEIRKLQRIVSERLKITKEQVWICVTHTFSAPHTRSEKQLLNPEIKRTNDQFCKALELAVEGALEDAVESMQETEACWALGHSDVNINRDRETADGWWLGFDEEGFSDKTLSVVCFKDKHGKPAAVLYNYDVQSSIMDHLYNNDGYRHISGDLAGRASRYVEENFPECVAVFLLGAAGDQAPRSKAQLDSSGSEREMDLDKNAVYKKGFQCMEEAGIQLGRDVIQAVEKSNCGKPFSEIRLSGETVLCEGQVTPVDMHKLHAVRDYDYQKNGQTKTPVNVLILGEAAFIGVQPELCSITASEIRKRSPYPLTFVVTMVNGAAKYMADEKSYERMSYEAMNSSFWKGSAERLRETALRLLNTAELVY